MTYPLAIFSPHIGMLSETFIQRHVRDLVPYGTVVVTDTINGPDEGYWQVESPCLILDRIASGEEPLALVSRFLQQHQVRVIMGEYLDRSLRWFGLARELGIRFFGHAHGYDVSRMLRDPRWRSEYRDYNQASGVITISQWSQQRLVALGVEPTKVYVVPCGVDVPAVPITRPVQDRIRCVAVGRMVAKKAPILMLDAFRRAADVCPNLELDYIGPGALLPAAHQFVQAFQLDDRVTLHGGQPNDVVKRLMDGADIFLQHSMTDAESGDEEGLPVAILEAMALSLPVVSTRHAGIPEAVMDGTTGYLVEEGDSAAMAESLIILARDSELRQAMGEQGWQRARTHFSWEQERMALLRILGLDDSIPQPRA